MRPKIFLYSLLILVLIATVIECRRSSSRGRSRGSSSSSIWGRSKSKAPKEPVKPAAAPKPVQTSQVAKPSAPAEPAIKRENVNVQQSAAKPPPPGWNVNGAGNNQNVGWKNQGQTSNVGHQPVNSPPINSGHQQSETFIKKESGGLQQSAAKPPPPGWNVNGAATNQGQGSNLGHQPGHQQSSFNHDYPKQQNVNPSQSGVYPNTGYGGNSYGYGNNYHQPYNPQQPMPGYQQPYNGAPNGYYPNSNMGVGGMNPNPYYSGGMAPGFGQPQQNQGLLGGMFGGNRHQSGYGYGGYGGYGGFGGYGGYGGYGMKKSGGFFGKHAFRNILAGLFVWHLVSGFTKRPYNVYNYYNQPETPQEEIKLPENILTLCNENATSLCAPGTNAICTTNNTILCVTSYNAASPCVDNKAAFCVNSTIPCIDETDPLCQNKTNEMNTTTVNLPCFTEMTIQKDSSGALPSSNITLPANENKFCVTTLAVPDNSVVIDENNNSTNINSNGNLSTNITTITTSEPVITNSTSDLIKI